VDRVLLLFVGVVGTIHEERSTLMVSVSLRSVFGQMASRIGDPEDGMYGDLSAVRGDMACCMLEATAASELKKRHDHRDQFNGRVSEGGPPKLLASDRRRHRPCCSLAANPTSWDTSLPDTGRRRVALHGARSGCRGLNQRPRRDAMADMDPSICTRVHRGLDVLLLGDEAAVREGAVTILEQSRGRKLMVAGREPSSVRSRGPSEQPAYPARLDVWAQARLTCRDRTRFEATTPAAGLARR
jgi:hypothetical protein